VVLTIPDCTLTLRTSTPAALTAPKTPTASPDTSPSTARGHWRCPTGEGNRWGSSSYSRAWRMPLPAPDTDRHVSPVETLFGHGGEIYVVAYLMTMTGVVRTTVVPSAPVSTYRSSLSTSIRAIP
jgi:hypothetical protein